MAEAAPNLRDRAFILSLYESGARIGEWLSLTVGSVSSSEYGYVVHIPHGKTGARRVLLFVISDFPGLKEVIAMLYPYSDHRLCCVHLKRNLKKHL